MDFVFVSSSSWYNVFVIPKSIFTVLSQSSIDTYKVEKQNKTQQGYKKNKYELWFIMKK